MQTAIVAALWAHYGAAIVLFGAALFRRLVPPESPDPDGDRRLRWALFGCALVALASGIALLMAESAAMAQDWAAALDPDAIGAVLGDTFFGRVWLRRLLLVVLAAVLALLWPPRRARVAAGGATVLASLALTGHAEAIGGNLLAINQAIHLLAAGAWLGALPPLAFRLARLKGDADGARRCLRRFSRYATLMVLAVLVSGLLNAIVLGGPPRNLPGSDYGKTLLAKLVIVAVMVVIACANRFLLTPALERRGDWAQRWLGRAVAAELALGLLAVLAASLLGTLAPPIG